MTFIATPFPENVSFGAVGGPGWQTDVVTVDGGNETRDQNWSQARGQWEVSHAARTPDKYNPLIAHFRLAGGRANSFPFKDWMDYRHNDAGGTGIFTMLTSTTFQLTKRYTSGSGTTDRFIYLPRSATITVTGGVGATVSYTTGVVTVSSGTPTSWTGEFYIPARYDTDQMHGEIIDKNLNRGLIMGWNSIPIVETRDYS